SAALGACKGTAKLRARESRRGDAPAGVARNDHATYLNEGGLRCRLGDRLELSAGRELLQWGSSFFLSPSNPFIIDTGKTNPIQQLPGKDLWQAQWSGDGGVTFAVIRNGRQNGQETDPRNFSPTSAVKVDWMGEQASAGAIVSRRDNGVRRLGLYGTLPLSKAALVYTDLSAGRGNAGWFAERDAGPLGWRLAQSKLDGDGTLFYSLLAGAAYTFESGWTLTSEYLRGNEGYDRAERQAYNSAAGSAARAFRAMDGGSGAAAALLGGALSPNLPYLGRDYLFLQLARNEWNDKGDAALRYVRPLGGGGEGALWSGSLTYYLSNHIQGFLVASRNVGGERSDFGRLIHSSVQAGLRMTY
ncbi:MAG: hypothetical protein ABIT83_19230, partial [Massilia sp.]